MKVKTVEYFSDAGFHQVIFKEKDVDRQAEKFASYLNNERDDVLKSSITISTQFEEK